MMSSEGSRDWNDYYRAVADRPLHYLYTELQKALPNSGEALDLGCGAGQGVLFLLANGFRVKAVDGEPAGLELLRAALPPGADVELIHSNFQDLPLEPGFFDVVVAQFSVFFLSSTDFASFWPRLVESIMPGGLFQGQILGLNDDWVSNGYAAFNEEGVRALFARFDLLYFEEAERDGQTAVGEPKHWHVFHVLARKR